MLRAYIAAAVFSAAIAVLALYVAFPGHQYLVFGPRAMGLFKDPNVLGPFLVPAALMLLEETVAPRLLRARLPTKLVLLSILTVGILFAFSRAAWLNFVLGAFVMFCVLSLRRGGGRRAVTFVVVGISAASVLFAALALTSSFTFLSERARLQAYDTQRFGAQHSGIELAVKYPLGIGPGQFERVSPISAHSTYVRALSEEGVLGLLVLLALLLLHPDVREPQRHPRPGHVRHRLGRVTCVLVRAAREQRVHRHAALAALLAARRADLGRSRPSGRRLARPDVVAC